MVKYFTRRFNLTILSTRRTGWQEPHIVTQIKRINARKVVAIAINTFIIVAAWVLNIEDLFGAFNFM